MNNEHKKNKNDEREEFLHLYHHCNLNPIEIGIKMKKSTRTIYRWLKASNNEEVQGLKDQSSGRTRQKKYPPEVFNLILKYKEENTRRSATVILQLLKNEGIHNLPSETTIRRYLRGKGMGRVSAESRRGYIVFERDAPNELWQIDIAGVQTVGHLGPLYLFAVIDDCSRFIPSAFYASNEKGHHVIRLLQKGFIDHGRPLQILADNGAQFRNVIGQLGTKYSRLLELLDIKPIFAKARHPQTKGKLERFFGSVKTMFLSEARFQVKNDPSISLAEFNQMLQTWLEFYNCKHRHRSLPKRCSPATVYLEKPNRIFRPLKMKVNWERWLFENTTRKVSKQNMISFQGSKYAIPPGFAGLKVTLLIIGEKFRVSRGDELIQEYSILNSPINFRSEKFRIISQSGTISYNGKKYTISYKMAGQRVLVRESGDGTELLVYARGQLIRTYILE
jgi:transposase InsO family protein